MNISTMRGCHLSIYQETTTLSDVSDPEDPDAG